MTTAKPSPSVSASQTTEPRVRIARNGKRYNPISKKNLIPFEKGKQANPKPGNSLTAMLKNALLDPLVKPPPDAPVARHIVYQTLAGALAREPVPFRETWDRTEGKTPDKHQVDIRSVSIVEVVLSEVEDST